MISIFCAFVFLFFFSASETLAGNIYLGPGQLAPSQTCLITDGPGSCDPAPALCWNSQSVGVTDCGSPCDGGDPWTKYNLLGCRQSTFDRCDNYYQPTLEAVCSTADKCTSTSNNPYLNAGNCSCQTLSVYKTCCSNTDPSYVSGNSCVQIAVDTTNPPYEGVCPAGTTAKFCGFGGYPACGQAACGPVGPVCGNNICESGEDVASCRPDCLDPSTLNTFSGSCTNNTYTANLSWSCSGNCAPLPSTDSACPNGFWVDISKDNLIEHNIA